MIKLTKKEIVEEIIDKLDDLTEQERLEILSFILILKIL